MPTQKQLHSKANESMVTFLDSNAILGDTLSETCDRLRKLTLRNLALAKERKSNPHVLPISKNKFLGILKNLYEKNTSLKLSDVVTNLIQDIRNKSVIGDYGRVAVLVTDAEMIPCNDTIIYLPKEKKSGNLPEKKYVKSGSSEVNPLVSAMGGSKEGWVDYLNNQKLSADTELFYKRHQLALEPLLQNLVFLDRYESFYTPDRMRQFSLKLPNGHSQTLCVFDSNASGVRGGQWLFAAPSGRWIP